MFWNNLDFFSREYQNAKCLTTETELERSCLLANRIKHWESSFFRETLKQRLLYHACWTLDIRWNEKRKARSRDEEATTSNARQRFDFNYHFETPPLKRRVPSPTANPLIHRHRSLTICLNIRFDKFAVKSTKSAINSRSSRPRSNHSFALPERKPSSGHRISIRSRLIPITSTQPKWSPEVRHWISRGSRKYYTLYRHGWR